MPKKKQRDSSSDTSLNSSDEESKKASKKQKTDDKKAKTSSSSDDSHKSWEIGKMKFVKVRDFRGKTFVDIREFYLDKNDAELKPGRKGISLSVENWNKLFKIVKEIDETVKEHS